MSPCGFVSVSLAVPPLPSTLSLLTFSFPLLLSLPLTGPISRSISVTNRLRPCTYIFVYLSLYVCVCLLFVHGVARKPKCLPQAKRRVGACLLEYTEVELTRGSPFAPQAPFFLYEALRHRHDVHMISLGSPQGTVVGMSKGLLCTWHNAN